MRIAYLAAGAAGTYCGACARDVALIRALCGRGHDVFVVPLYTPLRTDGPDPSAAPVFLNGVNAWLQQHVPLLRGPVPAWVERCLDSQRLLRFVSRFGVEIEAAKLGPMTVAMLRGENGRQRREFVRLQTFLQGEPAFDLVVITNSLLLGLAPMLRTALARPVVCHLQGEDTFLDGLRDPYRGEALQLVRELAQQVEIFTVPSPSYITVAAAYLQVEPRRLRVVPPAIDTDFYRPPATMASTDAQPWRLGFLSRLSAAKGLDLVVEAFIRLLVQHPTPPVSLAVAGEARGREVRTVARLRQRLREAGLHRQVEWCGKVDQDAKLTFLQGCTLFTIASRVPERRAIAGLEAMACGVPIVAPAQGILRELVEGTGGGVLVRPEDPEELASAWAHLLADAARRARLGAAARAGAERSYSLPVAAAAFEAVAAELQAASGPAR